MRRLPLFALICLVLVVGNAQAFAAPLAADQFLVGGNAAAGEYTLGTPFDNGSTPQNPTISGFSGAWNSVATSGTALWRPVATGLNHPSIDGEAGGSALFQFGSEVGVRSVVRSLTSPPTISTGSTFWMSGLVSLNENDPDFDGFAYAGFASDANNNNSTQGLRFGVEGDGSEMDLVFRHRSGAVVAESLVLADGIQAGDTHLVLIEAMVNSDLGGGGVPGNDNIRIWVDPTDVSSVTALGTPTLMVEDFSLFNNNAFSLLTLEGSNITGAGVLFDELFLGNTLEDVATPAVIPEPSAALIWALLGILAGVPMICRARRK